MTELNGRPVALTRILLARAVSAPISWQTRAKTNGFEMLWIENMWCKSPIPAFHAAHSDHGNSKQVRRYPGPRGYVIGRREGFPPSGCHPRTSHAPPQESPLTNSRSGKTPVDTRIVIESPLCPRYAVLVESLRFSDGSCFNLDPVKCHCGKRDRCNAQCRFHFRSP